jgi:hypothetical protein
VREKHEFLADRAVIRAAALAQATTKLAVEPGHWGRPIMTSNFINVKTIQNDSK